MSTHRNIPAGNQPVRHVNHALAALREAAECLEEAIAADEQPDVNVASALSHVAAARTALRLHGFRGNAGHPDRKAA